MIDNITSNCVALSFLIMAALWSHILLGLSNMGPMDFIHAQFNVPGNRLEEFYSSKGGLVKTMAGIMFMDLIFIILYSGFFVAANWSWGVWAWLGIVPGIADLADNFRQLRKCDTWVFGIVMWALLHIAVVGSLLNMCGCFS